MGNAFGLMAGGAAKAFNDTYKTVTDAQEKEARTKAITDANDRANRSEARTIADRDAETSATKALADRLLKPGPARLGGPDAGSTAPVDPTPDVTAPDNASAPSPGAQANAPQPPAGGLPTPSKLGGPSAAPANPTDTTAPDDTAAKAAADEEDGQQNARIAADNQAKGITQPAPRKSGIPTPDDTVMAARDARMANPGNKTAMKNYFGAVADQQAARKLDADIALTSANTRIAEGRSFALNLDNSQKLAEKGAKEALATYQSLAGPDGRIDPNEPLSSPRVAPVVGQLIQQLKSTHGAMLDGQNVSVRPLDGGGYGVTFTDAKSGKPTGPETPVTTMGQLGDFVHRSYASASPENYGPLVNLTVLNNVRRNTMEQQARIEQANVRTGVAQAENTAAETEMEAGVNNDTRGLRAQQKKDQITYDAGKAAMLPEVVKLTDDLAQIASDPNNEAFQDPDTVAKFEARAHMAGIIDKSLITKSQEPITNKDGTPAKDAQGNDMYKTVEHNVLLDAIRRMTPSQVANVKTDDGKFVAVPIQDSVNIAVSNFGKTLELNKYDPQATENSIAQQFLATGYDRRTAIYAAKRVMTLGAAKSAVDAQRAATPGGVGLPTASSPQVPSDPYAGKTFPRDKPVPFGYTAVTVPRTNSVRYEKKTTNRGGGYGLPAQ